MKEFINKGIEKTAEVYVSLMGNRVTLTSRLFTLSGGVGLYNNGIEDQLYSSLFGIALVCSGVTEIATAFGISTLDAYKRAREHLKGFGDREDDRFIEILSVDYCRSQGVKLALKHYNMGIFSHNNP